MRPVVIREGAVRVVKVLAAYVVLAGLLWVLLPVIRRTFLLPELFDTLTKGALAVGAALAALVAWRYPEMGVGERTGGDREGSDGRGGQDAG